MSRELKIFEEVKSFYTWKIFLSRRMKRKTFTPLGTFDAS